MIRPTSQINRSSWLGLGVLLVLAGAGLACLDTYVVYPVWLTRGWMRPPGGYLPVRGLQDLTSNWIQIWVRIPTWIEGVLLGAAIGALSRKRWLLSGVLAGVAMLITPHVISLIMGIHPYQLFGAVVAGSLAAWDCVLLLVLLPSAWLAAQLREKAFPPNCCRNCGYNLTGNTSGVCPECGGIV